MAMTNQARWLLVTTWLTLGVACGGSEAAPGGTAGSPVTAAGASGSATAGSGTAGSSMGVGGSPAAGSGAAGRPAAGSGAAGMAAGMAGSTAAGSGGPAATAGMGGTAGAAAGTGAGGSGGAGGSMGAAGAPASGGEFKLTSPVVEDGALLPGEYRGMGPSPELTWTAGPAGTMSYAIVFKDTTAGGFSEGFGHWTIYDIPSTTTSLPKDVMEGATITMPVMAKQGSNYSGEAGYAGPGAPSGTNTYRFTIYALDVAALPGLTGTPSVEQVEMAAEGANKLASAALNIQSMP